MITRKTFLSGSWKKKKKVGKGFVEIFLQNHKNKAYKTKEIAKAVKKCASVISHELRELKKQKKIYADSPFYMWK